MQFFLHISNFNVTVRNYLPNSAGLNYKTLNDEVENIRCQYFVSYLTRLSVAVMR